MNPDTQLTEEEIQQQLARDYVTGPKYFRGRQLAKLTMGLSDLIFKVVNRADTPEFHDACALYILAEAASGEARSAREKLMRDTDNADAFRAEVSIQMDDWTMEDAETAREIVHAILTAAENARVEITKKKEAAGAAEPILTPISLASVLSPSSPDSLPITSAG